ncbi:MAG: orotidine-5-phosphate decarboxylase [Thermoleophilales bacterium]|nr:orotidine-5-phosphate decarboxylase [Thermoleophilales bacterium]
MTTRNKLIVALDVKTAPEAQRLVDMLRGIVGMFKIGSQLFTATGPTFVREIVNSGEQVFLDLKFHDIPNTVAAAGVEATRLGISIFNVHAAGGSEMMRRTAGAVSESADSEGLIRPSIIAVTVLTSADQETLTEVGWTTSPESVVRNLSLLAETAGLDGVVASPREVGIVRSAVKKAGFIVVTPGVRPVGAALGDQSRVTTPREAIDAGADYLVVGRPIIEAPDPVSAALQIVDEMETGSTNKIR